MKTEIYPTSRQHTLVTVELKDETLIYDLTIDEAFSLNETSAFVWKICDGKKSIAEISRIMSDKFKAPVTEDLVWLTIVELEKNKLIADSGEIPARFKGLSRREIIRRVGIASAVALPLISSVIAPTAAQAQSGGAGLNQPCTGSLGT